MTIHCDFALQVDSVPLEDMPTLLVTSLDFVWQRVGRVFRVTTKTFTVKRVNATRVRQEHMPLALNLQNVQHVQKALIQKGMRLSAYHVT